MAAAFLFVGLLVFCMPHDSSASLPLKRILILFPYENYIPGFIQFESNLRSTLTAANDYDVEFYVECMDLTRFPSRRYQEKLMELYREKYSGLKIDLIIASQLPSLKFLADFSPESFRNTPVILYAQDPRFISDRSIMPEAVAVTGKLDMSGTLALAIRLHPEVHKIFVVTGASQFDEALRGIAMEELRKFENRAEIHHLSGLAMDDLVNRVSNLPERSLLFYISIFRHHGKSVFFSS